MRPAAFLAVLLLATSLPVAASPSALSARTLAVGIELDRDGARIVAFTIKPRPFLREDRLPEIRPYESGKRVQLEIVLYGGTVGALVRRVDVGPLCLDHPAETTGHVAEDTVLRHGVSFVIELPEIEGLGRIEVAYYRATAGRLERRDLGILDLDRESYTAAGGSLDYDDLVIAGPFDESEADEALYEEDQRGGVTSGAVHWPEEFGDTDAYRIFGNADEVGKRLSVVIVPDGYTYGQKTLMEDHAAALVDHFRAKTPFGQHDALINYVLVYAYSEMSGTTQCDCDIIVDTAMGSFFAEVSETCGDSANRCLQYGPSGCDAQPIDNIIAAELRAPAIDTTILMVNSTRHGGCGGDRATYTVGANGGGYNAETGIHELGHSYGGLKDEYVSAWICGTVAEGPNVSLDAQIGDWPEWIEDLGPPHEGANHYAYCVYRAESTCAMSGTFGPFCAVCSQHLTLEILDNPRVRPWVPIDSVSPAKDDPVYAGPPQLFTVTPRAATGEGVTHEITWSVQRPGDPAPVPVASGGAGFRYAFLELGNWAVRCDFIAETNFIKPERYGPNVGHNIWQFNVSSWLRPLEISPPEASEPFLFTDAQTMSWEEGTENGAVAFHLYRGDSSDLAAGDYGACRFAGLDQNQAVETESPPPGACWFYLVTGENPAGEGTMGAASEGSPRINGSPCDGGSVGERHGAP